MLTCSITSQSSTCKDICHCRILTNTTTQLWTHSGRILIRTFSIRCDKWILNGFWNRVHIYHLYPCYHLSLSQQDSVFSFLGTDQELRNVIDKLAQFVARNGPEFEKMTMEKQKDNPKFSFLFGGEYFSYYKYRLTMEQQQSMYSDLTNTYTE